MNKIDYNALYKRICTKFFKDPDLVKKAEAEKKMSKIAEMEMVHRKWYEKTRFVPIKNLQQ